MALLELRDVHSYYDRIQALKGAYFLDGAASEGLLLAGMVFGGFGFVRFGGRVTRVAPRSGRVHGGALGQATVGMIFLHDLLAVVSFAPGRFAWSRLPA